MQCFMVATPLASGAYARFFVLTDGVNSDAGSVQSWTPFINYDSVMAVARNSAYRQITTSITSNNPNLLVSYVESSGIFITPNGTATFAAANSGTTGNLSISRWVIGGNEAGSTTWDPRIRVGEILVYSNVLSSNVRSQIEGYLTAKWGLTSNLPVTHPLRNARSFMRPFVPVDISGCVLWLDGIDPSGTGAQPANSSAVNAWVDKSGFGYTFTKNPSYPAPIYQTSGINGRPSLSFTGTPSTGTGTTQFLENSNVTFTNTAYTIFAVANKTGGPTTNGYGYIMKGNITSDFYLFFGQNSGNIATFTGPSNAWNDVNQNLPATSISNTPRIVAISVSNTTLTPYYDGNAMSNKTGTTGAFSGIRLGETTPNANTGQNWNGLIGEVVIYSTVLTNGQRQQVETYLANKWGLRGNTPSNHPARLAPALTPQFNPLLLSDCGLWLDGGDATVFTMSGSNIVRWDDRSGNNRHAVSVNNPVLGTTTTGRQAVVLSGTNYFNVSGASTLSGGSMTIFAQASATTNGRNLLAMWGNTRVITFQLYYNGANNFFFTSNTLFFNSNAICCIVENISTNVCSSFFNGRADNTMAAASRTPNGSFILGANHDTGNGWIGNLQEVIIYNRALPTAERQTVEGYLAGKWGLQPTIPNGHPYKNTRI